MHLCVNEINKHKVDVRHLQALTQVGFSGSEQSALVLQSKRNECIIIDIT